MENSIVMNLKNSYMLVPLSVFVGLLLIHLDSRMSDTDLTRKQYVKYSLIIGVISLVSVYICNSPIRLDEEIIHGNPPF